MDVHVLEAFLNFSQEAHTKYVFFESDKLKAQVVCLEADQQIPPCQMDSDVIFFVLEGKGKIIIDEKEEILAKTSWVFVPKENESRSLKAKTRMAVLAIQIR